MDVKHRVGFYFIITIHQALFKALSHIISSHPNKQAVEIELEKFAFPKSQPEKDRSRFKSRPAWLQTLGRLQEVRPRDVGALLAYSGPRPGLVRKDFNITF